MVDRDRQLVLFVIDGLRPDALVAANTPNLDALISRGAHTLEATTVMPSVTLPCHMSMFTGVTPEVHGVTTNVWSAPPPEVISLFDLLKKEELTTAAFYNWEELRDLSKPGSLDVSFMVKDNTFDTTVDTQVADMAVLWLGANDFNFAFVYLVGTDHAGHIHGWMSAEYLRAAEHADSCIGRVVAALPDDCAVIVTSDHGGHDLSHGTACPEDMTTPIITASLGEHPGSQLGPGARITDIAPTVVEYFGVEQPESWIGRPLVGGSILH